ncbi:MAG: hypothetical protein WBS24_06610 [Terriglobales bacterium]
MVKRSIVLFFAALLLWGLAFAEDFPLIAHVKRIELDKKLILAQGTGGTKNIHLVIAEIEGRTYGLEVRRGSFHQLDWLHVQDYPCRKSKHGFELQYQDGEKTRMREFVIVSEE